ncbi:MAG: S8 family serine peptidase, partial [Dehalococcoidia bacterium]|nr:S8 family serine peptidase [Dehalococcoidia bacterium]
MRYAVIAKGMPLDMIEAEIKKVGGKDVTCARLLQQAFCELDEDQAEALARVPGLVVKPVGQFRTQQVMTVARPVETVSDVFYLLRSYFSPPLTGSGLTVAVLDSGIRKNHESLQGKVIYEANFTDSPTTNDVFGHGTQVAFMAAGGLHAEGTKAGVSPGARLFNLKVINDSGYGTDEGIVLAIDRVCDMAERARTSGLHA